VRIAVWHEALLLQITGDFGERSEWDEGSGTCRTAREAVSERSRGDASDIDGQNREVEMGGSTRVNVGQRSELQLGECGLGVFDDFGSDAPKSFAFALSASHLFSQRLNSSITQRLNILCQLVSVSHFQKCRQLSLPLFLLLLRLARNCGTKSFENLQGY